MRLFIAILFTEEVRSSLMSAIQDLKARSVSGNFTRAENLHLTLKFIGETKNVSAVKSVMDGVDAKPFELILSGSGRFGNLWWAGIDLSPELRTLADGLGRDLRRSGFDIEEREFKPHITLARELKAEKPLSLGLKQAAMPVTKLSLMRSDRIRGNLVYTEIYSKSL